MLQYTDLDIMLVQRDAMIIHGVNTLGKMGAGIARDIKERFPEVFQDYARRCSLQKYNGELLGEVNCYKTDIGYVTNIFSQKTIGRTGVHADPEAIRLGFQRLGKYFTNRQKNFQIFMPKIGCSLGGLDWETDVKWIIEEFDREHFSDGQINICTKKYDR